MKFIELTLESGERYSQSISSIDRIYSRPSGRSLVRSGGRADLVQESREEVLALINPKPSKPVKRATQIPKDWSLSDEDIDFARLKGVYNLGMGEDFRDYHTAKGTTSKDWAASWRTWVNNSIKFAEKRGGVARPTTTTEIADRALRYAAKDQESG